MKRIKYRISTVLILIALTVSAEVRSQQLPDSLAFYLETAARNNPVVRQKLLEYQAALEKVPQVGSLPDPELSAGLFLKPMELVGGNQIADLRLMQMFPWFGVLKNAKDEMSLMAKAKFELFRDARAQVYYDVQRTWYELYRIGEERRISVKNIEILKTIERLSLVKYKTRSSGSVSSQPAGAMAAPAPQVGIAGDGSGMQSMQGAPANLGSAPAGNNSSSMEQAAMGGVSGGSGLFDLYRIQIEMAGIENNLELLKNKERTLVAMFNSYLGRAPLSSVYVDTVLNFRYHVPSEEIVLDTILKNNPMLIMIEFEKQSLEARKKMVSGMSYPMVGLGVNYSLIGKSSMSAASMNGADMVMPMVSLTLPVYRKKYNAMKNEADLLKSATEENYKATVNSLVSELYSAFQLYMDASVRVELFEKQHNLVSRSLSLLLTDFSTSAASLTDLLRLQQQTLDYELELAGAKVDMVIASAGIQRLMASVNKQ